MSGEPVPDSWPPQVGAPARTIVPLFPLSGVFLFPNTLLTIVGTAAAAVGIPGTTALGG